MKKYIKLSKLREKPLNSHFESYLDVIPMGFETSNTGVSFGFDGFKYIPYGI